MPCRDRMPLRLAVRGNRRVVPVTPQSPNVAKTRMICLSAPRRWGNSFQDDRLTRYGCPIPPETRDLVGASGISTHEVAEAPRLYLQCHRICSAVGQLRTQIDLPFTLANHPPAARHSQQQQVHKWRPPCIKGPRPRASARNVICVRRFSGLGRPRSHVDVLTKAYLDGVLAGLEPNVEGYRFVGEVSLPIAASPGPQMLPEEDGREGPSCAGPLPPTLPGRPVCP
jgi:hypothetical protein